MQQFQCELSRTRRNIGIEDQPVTLVARLRHLASMNKLSALHGPVDQPRPAKRHALIGNGCLDHQIIGIEDQPVIAVLYILTDSIEP